MVLRLGKSLPEGAVLGWKVETLTIVEPSCSPCGAAPTAQGPHPPALRIRPRTPSGRTQDGFAPTPGTPGPRGSPPPQRRRTTLPRVLTAGQMGSSPRLPRPVWVGRAGDGGSHLEALPTERPPRAPPPPAYLPRQVLRLEEEGGRPLPAPSLAARPVCPVQRRPCAQDPPGLRTGTGEASAPVTPSTCQPRTEVRLRPNPIPQPRCRGREGSRPWGGPAPASLS